MDESLQRKLQSSNRLSVTTCAILALVCGLLLHNWVFQIPADDLSWRGEDDACYYFVIAKHLVAGHGPTFDASTKTNGFHPLWLGMVTTIFAAAPDDGTALRTIYLMQWMMYVGCAAALGVLALRAMRPTWALTTVLAFMTFPTISRAMLAGMETTLAVTCLIAAFCCLARLIERPGERLGARLAILAALSALAMLARLECGLLVPCIALTLIRSGRPPSLDDAHPYRNTSSKSILLYATAAVTPLAVYLVSSWLYFGAPTPVSGMIKRASAWKAAAHFFSEGDYLGFLNRIFNLGTPIDGLGLVAASQFGVDVSLVLLRGLGYFCLLAPIAIPAVRRRLDPVLGALLAFSIAYVFVEKCLFFGGPLPTYYLIPLFVTFPLAMGLFGQTVADALDIRFKQIAHANPLRASRFSVGSLPALAIRAGMFSLLLAGGAASVRYTLHRQHGLMVNHDGYYNSVYAAARWLREHTSPSETAAAWNAGVISFCSDRRVVNLDGYVNSVEYAHELTSPSRDMNALVEKTGANFLIDRISDGLEPLDRNPELQRNWALLYRSRNNSTAGLNEGFCVYAPIGRAKQKPVKSTCTERDRTYSEKIAIQADSAD